MFAQLKNKSRTFFPETWPIRESLSYLHEIFRQGDACRGIEHRAVRVGDEVRRYHGLFRVAQDATHGPLRCLLHNGSEWGSGQDCMMIAGTPWVGMKAVTARVHHCKPEMLPKNAEGGSSLTKSVKQAYPKT